METIEHRLSPSYLRRQGTLKAKKLAWEGTAKLMELAQRRSFQVSVLGAGAVLMFLGLRKGRKVERRRVAPVTGVDAAGSAAKALGAGLMWMLTRKRGAARREGEKPSITKLALAATAAKAFMGGARSSEKSGSTRPGRKEAWRGLANSIGSALGSYWYSHRGHRV